MTRETQTPATNGINCLLPVMLPAVFFLPAVRAGAGWVPYSQHVFWMQRNGRLPKFTFSLWGVETNAYACKRDGVSGTP